MTEYQKIENELKRLGWVPEQGRGDHVKFRKDGASRFITVSRSVTKTGRALLNTYAQIRRNEPAFTLGRPMGVAEDEPAAVTLDGEIDGGALPEGTPGWIRPGASVRWTSPEGRDWSRLSDENAVMSRQHVVLMVSGTDRQSLKVTIQDAAHEHDEFTVGIDELDAWQTLTCSVCGAVLPENRMASVDLERSTAGPAVKRLCPECLNSLNKKLAQKVNSQQPEPSKVDRSNAMLEQAKDKLDLLEEKFSAMKKSETSEADREALRKELLDIVAEFPRDMRRAFCKRFPELSEIIQGKPVSKSPYEAWKDFLSIAYDAAWKIIPSMEDEEFAEAYKKDLYASVYSNTRVLRDKQTGTKIPVMDVVAKTLEVEYLIWSVHDSIFMSFDHLYPDGAPWCICLQRRGGERQYLVNNRDRDSSALIETLERVLEGKEDEGCLDRTREDAQMPTLRDAADAVEAWARGVMGLPEDDDNPLSRPLRVGIQRSVRKPDVECFYDAPAYFSMSITYDCDKYPKEKYGPLVEALTANPAPEFPFPLTLSACNSEEDEVTYATLVGEDFGRSYDIGLEELPHNEDYGYGTGQTLLRFIQANGHSVVIEGVNTADDAEATKEYRKRLKNAFMMLLADRKSVQGQCLLEAMEGMLNGEDQRNDDDYLQLLRKYFGAVQRGENPYDTVSTALRGLPEEEEKEITPKFNTNTENTMNNNILDNKNPGSQNQTLRDATTRELLRELKERGVEFSAIRITVRQDIDMEAI